MWEKGDQRYKPPEILLDGCKYDFGIDIWSAGCIVYEMMNGEVLFEGSDPATQICQIFQVLGIPPPSYWPELGLNPRFQEIRTILEKFCSTVETMLETYDIKTRLRDRFTNSSNLHWRDNADAFKLLEACLQPYGPKRVAAKEALEMDFLVKPLVSSKIGQTHFSKSQKSGYNINRRIMPRIKYPPRPDT
ncbi:CTD kinase subunit alpha, partial [Taenia solium]